MDLKCLTGLEGKKAWFLEEPRAFPTEGGTENCERYIICYLRFEACGGARRAGVGSGGWDESCGE